MAILHGFTGSLRFNNGITVKVIGSTNKCYGEMVFMVSSTDSLSGNISWNMEPVNTDNTDRNWIVFRRMTLFGAAGEFIYLIQQRNLHLKPDEHKYSY
jgi:hypothetical protein